MIDHALLLAYYYPPDTEAGALRPSHFARYLPQFGITPTVITASDAPQLPPEAIAVKNRTRRPVRTQPLGFTEMALRKFLFPHDEGMLWSFYAFPAAARQLRPTSVVLSSFPPVNTHLIAYRLKRRFAVPWIADFRDPLVEAPTRLVPNQTYRYGRWSEAVDRRIEARVFHHADLIIANTDQVLARWQKRYPQYAAKLRLLWNGFDSADPITPLPIPARPRRELVHVGGIFVSRHPNALLESCHRLISNGRLDPATLLIRLIGVLEPQAIRHRATFDDLVSRGVLDATGKPVPRQEARRALCEADLLLLLDVLDFGGGQQLPSKVFEYAQIGRPILTFTVPGSPLEAILERSGLPQVTLYPDASPERVDEAVLRFLALPSEPVPASDWLTKTFDARHRVETLAGWIRELSPAPGSRR